MNSHKMTDEEVCQIIMCQYPEEESVDGSVNQDQDSSSSPSVPAPKVGCIQNLFENLLISHVSRDFQGSVKKGKILRCIMFQYRYYIFIRDVPDIRPDIQPFLESGIRPKFFIIF